MSSRFRLEDDDAWPGPRFVLNANWEDKFIDEMARHSVSILRLSRAAGWTDGDVEFLPKLLHIGLKGLEIYSWPVRDVSPIMCLPGLEYIALQTEFRNNIDFSVFFNLRICKVFWRPGARSLFACKGLESLNIVNYPESDLAVFSELSGLSRLQLTSRILASLDGIESASCLKTLDLADCTKLKSIEAIRSCAMLSHVELSGCRGLSRLDSLQSLSALEVLLIENCGTVESIKPIGDCTNLRSVALIGDTKIADGDLTPLLALPKLASVSIREWGHYSHSREEITAAISEHPHP